MAQLNGVRLEVSTVTFDPERHHRRSIRLEDYDYSWAGAYFLTTCAHKRACLFGEIRSDEMIPNPAGMLVQSEWDALPKRFPMLELDAFVLMPNHVHGIVVITEDAWTSEHVDQRAHAGRGRNPDVGATLAVAHSAENRAGTRPAPTLGDVVGAFKSLTTHRYVIGLREHGWPGYRRRLWQRNYYEHIIRNSDELKQIRQYIADNPAQWMADRENPDRSVSDVAGKRDEAGEIAKLFGGVRP
jgi:putative transposase